MQADELVWIDNENRCLVPANQTVSLSIMAGFLVFVMQISLTVAGGCLCCNYRFNKFSDPAPLAIKSLILSWYFTVNSKPLSHEMRHLDHGDRFCDMLTPSFCDHEGQRRCNIMFLK